MCEFHIVKSETIERMAANGMWVEYRKIEGRGFIVFGLHGNTAK